MPGVIGKSAEVALLAVFLWLSFGAQADQNDERLDGLFEALRDAGAEETASDIEQEIWLIWLESGRSDVDTLMASGIQAMQRRALGQALSLFDRVVEMAPEYAEGWNKRATVHYLRDDLAESVYDIRRTLVLEPRHFGALSGMGLILAERKDKQGAIRAFEEVLRINPNSPSARASIEELRAKLRDEAL